LTWRRIVEKVFLMPYRAPWELEDRLQADVSAEVFDRIAFAERALALLGPPPGTTVAILAGASRMRVEAGRTWGKPGERWAMLAVPPNASRHAIALAVAQIAEAGGPQGRPWAFDVLFGSIVE
jgi:hypothetical protein